MSTGAVWFSHVSLAVFVTISSPIRKREYNLVGYRWVSEMLHQTLSTRYMSICEVLTIHFLVRTFRHFHVLVSWRLSWGYATTSLWPYRYLAVCYRCCCGCCWVGVCNCKGVRPASSSPVALFILSGPPVLCGGQTPHLTKVTQCTPARPRDCVGVYPLWYRYLPCRQYSVYPNYIPIGERYGISVHLRL